MQNIPANFTTDEIQTRLSLLLRVGEMLIESQADTARILRTLYRIAHCYGLPNAQLHIHMSYSMLLINFCDNEQASPHPYSITRCQHCAKHRVNMQIIACISTLSVEAMEKHYTIEQFEAKLDELKARPSNYISWDVSMGAAVACGGFCMLFGGDVIALAYAALSTLVGFRIRHHLVARHCNVHLGNFIAALCSTLVAWLTALLSSEALANHLPQWLHSATPMLPIVSAALYIVPGVPLINFISDMLEGHVEVGITRAVNTVIIIFCMAAGITIVAHLCQFSQHARELSIAPSAHYLHVIFAAGVAAMGFSLIFNTPRRLLPFIAGAGVIAVLVRNVVFHFLIAKNGNVGMALTFGTFLGAALVSLLVIKVSEKLNVPHHCIAIPSVIPMVPGVMMFRAILAITQMQGVVGEVTYAMYNAVTAALVILSISIGVAIPNTFIRRLIKINA